MIAEVQEVKTHPFPGVTVVDRFPAGYRRPLQQGDHFRYSEDCGLGDQVFEVVVVTAASALVRTAAAVTHQYLAKVMKTRTVNGQKFKVDMGEVRMVEFSVPQRAYQISRGAMVEVVSQ